MGTSLVIISSYIGLLFMVCFNVEHAVGFDSCPDLSCGNQAIRFPFQIKGNTPQHCGYPGFDLVCSSNNETVIELPNSVKLNVRNIHYKKQTIELYDPHECLISQLHKLGLFSSHFQYQANSSIDYNFFNCSIADRDLNPKFMLPCLTTSNSQLYAIPSSKKIENLPLSFCTKMFNISSIPSDFLHKDNILHLIWSEPNCKHCESKRKICGWKNHSANNEIDCFVNPKGNPLDSKASKNTTTILAIVVSQWETEWLSRVSHASWRFHVQF